MQFTTTLLMAAVLGAAPIFATPLEARDTFVNCKPKDNKSATKTFKVSVDNARSQAQAAGFSGGKSGDPHHYGNGDQIHWGVDNCDNGKNPMYEYPLFWDGAKQKEWKKDTKSKDQDKTPIRVVYVNKNGGISYCGVMTHSEVDKNYQGKAFFQKCE